jgi:N-methylhydantoinase B
LHTDAKEIDDPVTFEVIRHSLWNINQQHGSIIENLSVSPITLETRDFQTAILTEKGEILFFGPYLQYMSGMLDIMAQYILERKGHLVADGDMWLQNDPWVGTAHQPDVGLLCPVFYGGELFCWVVNCAHQNDVGGTVAGSFCPNAQDIFWDPPLFPPMRMVKDGKIDEELEALYRRQSRTPVNLALDLRAAVAGNSAARSYVLALIDKYGSATVKGVMNGIMDASQAAFRSTLATIPDGQWSERCYQEVALTGDRGTYQVQVTLKKEGDVLTIDNEGTDPQVGAINLPFAGWRGGTVGALNVLVMADQMGAVGGAVRQLDFKPVPGTITCPDYGVAVSPAGIFATELSIAQANSVFTKMLLCSSDRAVRSRALATSNAQWQLHIHAGTNQRGTFYVGPMLDTMIGASGPSSSEDGEFANGQYWIPEGRGPNVESYERDWPILYLYRREDLGSGGAGRFQGGNGGEIAYIPYGGEMALVVYTSEGIPKTPGILGGDPASTGKTMVYRKTNVLEQFAKGELPDSCKHWDGFLAMGKGESLSVGGDDVLWWNWAGTAGFGDPLTRSPARVGLDVAGRRIARDAAKEVYGVILDEDGDADHPATLTRRQEMRANRLRAAGSQQVPSTAIANIPEADLVIGDDVWVDGEARVYRCAHCGGGIGSLDAHPKADLLVHEHAIGDIGVAFEEPHYFVDETMVWREFFCPCCATRLATEVAKAGDEPLVEFRLARHT